MSLQKQHLTNLRVPLLDLHRSLIEDERQHYERAHGRVTAGELLRLALEHPQFAWLHPISALIVRIDELLARDTDATTDEVVDVAAHVHARLKPSEMGTPFAKRYDQ